MRRNFSIFVLIFIHSVTLLANPMDIVLSRFVKRDNSGNIIFENGYPVPDQESYENLAMDLAFGIAPKLLAPADTLGYSGFYLGLEGTLTVIDSNASYWKEGVERKGSPDDVLFVPSIHIRKGLPFSFELGFSISYVSDSEMVVVGGDLSFSPFEGFRYGVLGYLPDLKVRFSGSYLTGEDELALGLMGVDVSISYPFTILGIFTITPYAGWQYLWVGIDHEIVVVEDYIENPQQYKEKYHTDNYYIDFTPRNFGSDAGVLTMQRIFIGFRVLWEHLTITPEFAFTPTGKFQFSLGVGTDF